MSKIPSVLWTCDQGLEIGDKARARANIGAAETLSSAQLAACNSGITSSKVTSYDDHLADSIKHVTSSDKTAWNNKYDLPNGGIPLNDLSSGVQSSLGLADSAVQGVKFDGKSNLSISNGIVTIPYAMYQELPAQDDEELAILSDGVISATDKKKLDEIVSFSKVSAGGNTLTAGAYNSTLSVTGGGDVTVAIENNSLKISSSTTINNGLLKFTLNGEGSGTSTDFTANSQDGATFNIPAASYDTSTNPTTYRAGVMTGQDKEMLDTLGAHSHGNLSYTGCITGIGSTPSLNDRIVISHGSNAELDIASTLTFNPSASVTEERNAVSIKGTWYKYQPDLQKLEVEHNASDDSDDSSVCTGRDMYTRAYNAWNLGLTPYYYDDFHKPGDHGIGSRCMYQCTSVDNSYCSFTYLGLSSGSLYTTTHTYYNTGVVTSTYHQTYRPYSETMDAVDELLRFRTYCVARVTLDNQTASFDIVNIYRYDKSGVYQTLTGITDLTTLVQQATVYTDDISVIIQDGYTHIPGSALPTSITKLNLNTLKTAPMTGKFTMRVLNTRNIISSTDDGSFYIYVTDTAAAKVFTTIGNSLNQSHSGRIRIHSSNQNTDSGVVTAFSVTTSVGIEYSGSPYIMIDLLATQDFKLATAV